MLVQDALDKLNRFTWTKTVARSIAERQVPERIPPSKVICDFLNEVAAGLDFLFRLSEMNQLEDALIRFENAKENTYHGVYEAWVLPWDLCHSGYFEDMLKPEANTTFATGFHNHLTPI